MKIGNVNVEEFLKEDGFVLNREKTKKVEQQQLNKKPSIKRKHVKKESKVELALQDLEKNHDWSWYEEVKSRYSDCMDNNMTFYRGNEKTGAEVFAQADKLATALRFNGINKGDEILVCISNVPEELTLLLAASKCGAIVHFIGSGFDPKYIKKIIKDNKNKKLFIGTDDEYGKISHLIKDAGFKHKVIISLTDSLENGKDPYEEYDKDFYKFENKVPYYKKEDSEILSFNEYLELGKDYKATFPKVGINDEFTITYTSGSTKIGWPKAIVHRNKTYMAIGRFHDSDLSRMPAMRNMRGIAHIPTHSNTNISSSISDPIFQKCTVAFEPIYNPKFFAYSLIINEAGFVPATRSFWLEAIETFKEDERLKDKTLPYAINYVSVGEDIVKNEIKYIDNEFKRLKAGSEKLPKPLSPVTLSVGGGDCEHGGLFFTLFKSLREKVSIFPSLRKNYGLTPFQLADVVVLHEDGTECDYNEIGTLAANSACTMKEYKNNEEATQSFYVKDAYDRIWGNCNIYSYIGNNGNVVMKGRKDSNIELSTGKKVPNFLISDTILEDDKHVLSCEVVTVKDDNNQDIAVAHIQLLPQYSDDTYQIIKQIDEVCYDKFSEELADRVVYKVHTRENNPYPLTKSGKRSIRGLEEEGVDKCIKPYDPFYNGKKTIFNADSYLKHVMDKYTRDNENVKIYSKK